MSDQTGAQQGQGTPKLGAAQAESIENNLEFLGLFHFVWKATVYKGAIIPVKTLRSAPCKKPFFAKPWA